MDEPCFKSVFQISVYSDIEGHEVLSNTPCSGVVDKWWQFEETPLMSTYLLAFVIGKFEFVEFHTLNGVRVRGYTPKGLSH